MIMMNVLNIITIIFVCLIWGCTDGAQEREVDSHFVQLSSLFTSPASCILSPKASHTKSSLHVVHMYGPCSGNTESPEEDDILKRDQERVNFIQSKFSTKFTDRVKPNQMKDIPVKDGKTIGSGSYYVTIGIGTPKHNISVVFDTGSSLTWIQCKPCTGSCYSQKEPIFNPSSSSSFSNVTCSSPVCATLKSEGDASGCFASNCGYKITYLDKTSSEGIFAKERLTLTPSDATADINFGCGQNNIGHKNIAGILGLGRGKLSFPLQTVKTYKDIFSYCLPSRTSFTGHLTFGSAGISKSVKYTPLSRTRIAPLYVLEMVGINFNGKKLNIPLIVFSTPACVIDSGTTITHLPPKAYNALRSAFKESMSKYKATVRRSVFDTCYDITGVAENTLRYPEISLAFNGGTVVDLYPTGLLSVMGKTSVCLAFVANQNDDDVIIYGSMQQQTLQIVFDGPGKRIGFAPDGCD